ncbi:MAG: SAM-dependent methyltransferase, partial [Myxococcota bacterium]
AAGWSFAARAALAVALIAPVGACLGVFLPTGIEALKRESAAHIPWAWGVNGIASVLAPVACVAVAESWGIGVVLLAGATIYAGVGALAHRASS